jgi:hypothetical protein
LFSNRVTATIFFRVAADVEVENTTTVDNTLRMRTAEILPRM